MSRRGSVPSSRSCEFEEASEPQGNERRRRQQKREYANDRAPKLVVGRCRFAGEELPEELAGQHEEAIVAHDRSESVHVARRRQPSVDVRTAPMSRTAISLTSSSKSSSRGSTDH